MSAIVTTQDGRADTRNVDSTLGYRRLLSDRWFAFASVGIQRSDELGIDLRSSVGAGGGRALLQTNTMMWSIAAGLVANKEEADGGGGEANLESELGTEFSIFDFDGDARRRERGADPIEDVESGALSERVAAASTT